MLTNLNNFNIEKWVNKMEIFRCWCGEDVEGKPYNEIDRKHLPKIKFCCIHCYIDFVTEYERVTGEKFDTANGVLVEKKG